MDALAALSMSSVLRGELQRVGNNLNQAVHAMHVHGADGDVLAALQEALVQVRAVVGAVQEHAGASGARGGVAGATSSRGASSAAVKKATERAPRRAARTVSAVRSEAAERAQGQPVQQPAERPVNRWTGGGAK